MTSEPLQRARLDRWLWAARFFKTRRLAVEAVRGGKVRVSGVRAKPAKEIRVGDELRISKGAYEFVVVVEALSERRGPAVIAQRLYRESESSLALRQRVREQQRAAALAMPRTDQRPERRDRRRLAAFKRGRGE